MPRVPPSRIRELFKRSMSNGIVAVGIDDGPLDPLRAGILEPLPAVAAVPMLRRRGAVLEDHLHIDRHAAPSRDVRPPPRCGSAVAPRAAAAPPRPPRRRVTGWPANALRLLGVDARDRVVEHAGSGHHLVEVPGEILPRSLVDGRQQVAAAWMPEAPAREVGRQCAAQRVVPEVAIEGVEHQRGLAVRDGAVAGAVEKAPRAGAPWDHAAHPPDSAAGCSGTLPTWTPNRLM